jgi:salicylate hydroxylase
MATNNKEHEEQPPYPGRAGVVGAGISGLSAAIALRRAGWHVEVFERSQFKTEIGAAITVTPNAALVLDRWGFDMEKAEAVPNQSKVTALASDPSIILDRLEYADKASELGFGIWSLHRVDLHRGLRDLAAAPTAGLGSGPPVHIRLGCEVRQVDCEEGTLKLGDGRLVNKDLLVIADGAHVSVGKPGPDKQC